MVATFQNTHSGREGKEIQLRARWQGCKGFTVVFLHVGIVDNHGNWLSLSRFLKLEAICPTDRSRVKSKESVLYNSMPYQKRKRIVKTLQLPFTARHNSRLLNCNAENRCSPRNGMDIGGNKNGTQRQSRKKLDDRKREAFMIEFCCLITSLLCFQLYEFTRPGGTSGGNRTNYGNNTANNWTTNPWRLTKE